MTHFPSRKALALAAAMLSVVVLMADASAQQRPGGGRPGGGRPSGGGGQGGGPSAPVNVPRPAEYTVGYVRDYNQATKTLTLNNGASFRLAPAISSVAHPPGEKVRIRWSLQAHHRYADEVVITQAAPTPVSAPEAAPPPAAAPGSASLPAAPVQAPPAG
jgi:hypothetical protein